ncbi:hypothetical protein [Neisseria sp. S1]|uniref:hypothetical protein n=1 Tax=Neisseria sp. S1 TaxID=3318354 RepID=UPI003A84C0AB
MNDQKIYQELGKLLWSIMDHDAQIFFCDGYIYPEITSYSFSWIDFNGQEKWFDFDDIRNNAGDEVTDLIKTLSKNKIFKEKWSHYRISLTNEAKFNIQFFYIPEEDHWPGLYSRGISDLTEEEAENIYYVPKELWEERVKLKRQQQS